jgi:peptide/nickel transport system permease protein
MTPAPGGAPSAGTPSAGTPLPEPAARSGRREVWQRFRSERGGVTGLVILALFLLMALIAPLLFSADGLDVTKATGAQLARPSAGYLLGTDENGRSVLALVFWGARISLLVGLAATAISMLLGTGIGIASAHFRGLGGAALERLTDWFLVIPFLPLVIVLATVVGHNLTNVIIAIGITSWPGTARLVRAQTLTVEARPYVERARALGGGDWHVMSRHVLPNVMPLVLANTTLTVAIAILSETTLSFLGLGDPFAISWGSVLESAFANGAITLGAWWYVVPPGVCVVVVVLAFTLIGRSLETALNPRLRERR